MADLRHNDKEGVLAPKPYAAIAFEPDRRSTKKDSERRILEGALERLELTGWMICLQESPDAVVDFRLGPDHAQMACEIQTLHADSGTEYGGSSLRRFEHRWIRVMERVLGALAREGAAVPYCRVDFLSPTYSSLDGLADDALTAEFTAAGKRLQIASRLDFPDRDLPHLSAILRRITVTDSDGQGLLWWPSHLQTGVVAGLDDAVTHSILRKNELARKFDWGTADEKVLLLVAEGRGITDLFGGAREIAFPPVTNLEFTWVVIWDKFSGDIWALVPEFRVIYDGEQHVRRPEHLPVRLRPFATTGVTRDVPPGVLAAGNPCRVLRSIEGSDRG